VRLRRAQSVAHTNGVALKISRELISQKIDGQAAIVRDMLDNSVAADVILRFKAELAETNDIDAIRLVESQAAKMCWSQWADSLGANRYGVGQSRRLRSGLPKRYGVLFVNQQKRTRSYQPVSRSVGELKGEETNLR
jgi:CRISPR/Cas system-associated endonuclease Cas1